MSGFLICKPTNVRTTESVLNRLQENKLGYDWVRNMSVRLFHCKVSLLTHQRCGTVVSTVRCSSAVSGSLDCKFLDRCLLRFLPLACLYIFSLSSLHFLTVLVYIAVVRNSYSLFQFVLGRAAVAQPILLAVL
ncbi:hypothetical protein CI102_8341 [Trichoderma harzianum]|nr:hypothetical protein CI102_8341 [Trichoderma harzianum]